MSNVLTDSELNGDDELELEVDKSSANYVTDHSSTMSSQ